MKYGARRVAAVVGADDGLGRLGGAMDGDMSVVGDALRIVQRPAAWMAEASCPVSVSANA